MTDDALRALRDAKNGITCTECGMKFKAGVSYGFSCPRGSKCGLIAQQGAGKGGE